MPDDFERPGASKGLVIFPIISEICRKKMTDTITKSYLQELNAEYWATRACLEKIPEVLFEYKPHPKSMNLGYLSLLVAEIPLWIKFMVTDGEIDFVTFKHFTPKTTKELVEHFEDNMKAARQALQTTNDEAL